MNLPNQALPISRVGQSSFNGTIGIRASGDGCKSGSYCCEGITGKTCRKCVSMFGSCVEPAATTCARYLEIPSSGC